MEQAAWTWIVDLPVAALMLWLTVRWGFMQSLANRLLAMLHIGFVWYGIGFLLAGAHSLLVLAGFPGLPLGSLHALAIGFASSLLMAMVTRVTCGHSGQDARRRPLTWRLFVLLQLTAVVRIGAAIAVRPGLARRRGPAVDRGLRALVREIRAGVLACPRGRAPRADAARPRRRAQAEAS